MLKKIFIASAAAVIIGFGSLYSASVSLPDPAVGMDLAPAKSKQTAVLAAGCFWSTEAVFESLNGVDKVLSGYAGGRQEEASYEIVGSGRTNHAESVEITFDPNKISYGQLLKVYFSVAHDPTQKDRQGADWGRQYRSAIFYKNEDQKRIAEAYIKQLEDAHAFGKPIVTEVTPLKGFFRAEEYHQEFVKKNPNQGYVRVSTYPKLDKLKKQFPQLLKN